MLQGSAFEKATARESFLIRTEELRCSL